MNNIALAALSETFQQWPTSHARWVETGQWAGRMWGGELMVTHARLTSVVLLAPRRLIELLSKKASQRSTHSAYTSNDRNYI